MSNSPRPLSSTTPVFVERLRGKVVADRPKDLILREARKAGDPVVVVNPTGSDFGELGLAPTAEIRATPT